VEATGEAIEAEVASPATLGAGAATAAGPEGPAPLATPKGKQEEYLLSFLLMKGILNF
jgi:hypothetical protein